MTAPLCQASCLRRDSLLTSFGTTALSVLSRFADRDQTNLLLAEFDLELIPWFQIEHGGVSLAHQQIAVP